MLSRTLGCGWSTQFWNTMATLRSIGGFSVTSRPSMWIVHCTLSSPAKGAAGSIARSRWSDEDDELAFAHGEVDILQHFGGAEAAAEAGDFDAAGCGTGAHVVTPLRCRRSCLR